MVLLKLFIFMLPVLRRGASCEAFDELVPRTSLKSLTRNCSIRCLPTRSSSTIIPSSPIEKYEVDFNVSKTLQKDDRKLMLNWTDEYQIKRLDVTMRYRLQMIKHQEHSLKSDGNVKWIDCLFVHRKEIRRSIRFYHENEHECLRTTTSKDAENKEDVEQLEKQIIKWRKGYRYLINLCNDENPTDKGRAQQCLIEYMQNDKYDEVIQRLMLLKQGAMSDLYSYYNSSLIELEDCLKTQLSRYLERIRSIMDTLNKCYSFNS